VMSGDDERLAALIDDELDAQEKAALLERLAGDEALRERLAAMRRDRERLAGAFDALLAAAPVERLRAAVVAAADRAPRAPRRRLVGGWLQLAAGLVIGVVIAGLASWLGFGPGSRGDDWRHAVVEYMDLYTPDTFALANPDDAAAAKQLQAVSVRVGAELTPAAVAVPGLRFRAAFNLAYDGSALAEIAYTAADGAPVLFCAIADGAPDEPPRTVMRNGQSYVAWARGGKSYMVVARMAAPQVADLARTLVSRF